MPPITHATSGATGIGVASGLPAGVTATWSSNTITISGTPENLGTFNYSIPLAGGSATGNAEGIITVVGAAAPDAVLSSNIYVNQQMPDIKHVTVGVTSIGSPVGLPAGLAATWAVNAITISGTPTETGTFAYNIPLNGICESVGASGTITVYSPPNCGAYVAPGEWKAFKCHNLGADESADPFAPTWRLNGDYYQWGRSNVASVGPTGLSNGEANFGDIAGWDMTEPPSGAWIDASKTDNDPCPAGFRLPTATQWDAVVNPSLNELSYSGTWSESSTNYSSGLRIGTGAIGLFLPSAGGRDYRTGTLFNRGNTGYYWSSTENGIYARCLFLGAGYASTGDNYLTLGLSVRCISE
jgi:uncharacterized protein (TIGR02145 family)